jgi:hypothetical protein
MQKRTKLKTALLLVAAVNMTYAEESCFPPKPGETPLDVLECISSVQAVQQQQISELTAKTEKQQATINTQQGLIDAQQKRIAEFEKENKVLQQKTDVMAYYFTGSFATPTEWMADVIFNGNYKRFCEAIDKTYVKAQLLQKHYHIGKGNGHFYSGWYYVGNRYCESDTHVWSQGKPEDNYNVWRYSGKCGCCIEQQAGKTRWTFEISAIIWCK